MKNNLKLGLITFSTSLSVFLLIGAVLGQDRQSKEPYRPLAVLSEVLSRIQTDYVEEPNFDRVTEGALQGMVEALDPYNSYLTPQLYSEYKRGWRGEASIGAVISKKFGLPGIVSVVPGGPADSAGLQPGDILEAISGRSSREMSYEEVLARLDGPAGSKVSLAVVRQRAQEPKQMELIRAVVADPPVETKVLDGEIGYLKVRALPTGISKELATRIDGLRRSGAKSFLLDLRDSASGDMQEGPAVANLFIAEGLLGFVEGQQYPRQNFLADKAKAVASEPASVLVNESTGGAAELVAAAFLDTHRGDVVGARTFGIGAVQRVIPLPDGAAVVLSVAKFHTPAGKKIQDSGVTPSEVVEQQRDFVPLTAEDSAEYEEPEPESSKPKEDLQLKRAIELLQAEPAEEALPRAA